MLKTTFAVVLMFLCSSAVRAGDWPTFGHDPQRSGWAVEETAITPENASKLTLLWKANPKNQFYRLSALTSPVVASHISTTKGLRSVVYTAGITGTVFAFDAETGEPLWSHHFQEPINPGKGLYQGTFLCPNGITATPVIDKSTNRIYVISPEGQLYGLDLGSGDVRYGPVQFVAPYSKNWSLNLVGNTLYTALAQGCGNGISGFYSIDVSDRHRPVIRQLLLSNTNTAGIWGRGGPIIGANGLVYGATADGKFSVQEGDYSLTVISAKADDLALKDYYLPLNWEYLNKKDLDLGAASPIYFGWKNRNLLASGAKEGVIYLLDADHVGGSDHVTSLYITPRIANDSQKCCSGYGLYGGMATARDAQGVTWLYAPMGGKPSEQAPKFPNVSGDNSTGNIVAFKVVEDPKTQNPVLEPAWMSGGFNFPDPPVVANGVVFAVSTGEVMEGSDEKRLQGTRPAVLRALDAATGKELFNSGETIKAFVHFSGLAVSDGRVFAVDHDSNLYCFGLPAKTK